MDQEEGRTSAIIKKLILLENDPKNYSKFEEYIAILNQKKEDN